MISDASTVRPAFAADASDAGCRPPIEANGPFDLLHAYQGMPAVVSAPVARRLGVPLVVTLDSGELTAIDDIAYGLQRRWFDRRGIAAAVRAAARVTVATAFMARMVPEASQPRAGRRRSRSASTRAPFRRRPRVEGPPWRLLRVASINAREGLPDAASRAGAARRPRPRRPPRHRRRRHDGRERAGADARARPRARASRFTDFSRPIGWRPSTRARTCTSCRRATRRPASSILEAAAAGLATVGTAVGYVADWHPDRAVAVPVQDPAALANAIGDLLQDPRGVSSSHRPRASGRSRTTRTGPRHSSSGSTARCSPGGLEAYQAGVDVTRRRTSASRSVLRSLRVACRRIARAQRPPDDRLADGDADGGAGAAERGDQHGADAALQRASRSRSSARRRLRRRTRRGRPSGRSCSTAESARRRPTTAPAPRARRTRRRRAAARGAANSAHPAATRRRRAEQHRSNI